jgi:hypothetical protein
MARLLIVVSRTKPGTYTFMKLVSESEHDVILDRRKANRRRIHQTATLSDATASGGVATSRRNSRKTAGRRCADRRGLQFSDANRNGSRSACSNVTHRSNSRTFRPNA